MNTKALRTIAAAVGIVIGIGNAPASAQDSGWVGPYAGLLLGKGFSNIGGPSSTGLGWTFAAFGGYNFATSGHLLAGIDADISKSGRGTNVYDIPWTSSVRLRVGAAFDKVALFVAGGLSLAGFNFMGGHSTELGWTLGGGVEFRLERVIARVEYLYARYGVINGTDVTAATHEIRWGWGYAF